jgi:hypothetical protein
MSPYKMSNSIVKSQSIVMQLEEKSFIFTGKYATGP